MCERVSCIYISSLEAFVAQPWPKFQNHLRIIRFYWRRRTANAVLWTGCWGNEATNIVTEWNESLSFFFSAHNLLIFSSVQLPSFLLISAFACWGQCIGFLLSEQLSKRSTSITSLRIAKLSFQSGCNSGKALSALPLRTVSRKQACCYLSMQRTNEDPISSLPMRLFPGCLLVPP